MIMITAERVLRHDSGVKVDVPTGVKAVKPILLWMFLSCERREFM